MTDTMARQIVLASRPEGAVRPENFRLEEVATPVCPPGGLLLRTLFLSLDPYMRGRMDDRKSYATPVAIGGVMEGESVAEVIGSEHPDHAVGDLVLARTGWRTHAPSDGTGLRKLDPALAPLSTRLGVLGMPGFTAYAGLKVIGRPKPGETVVVAAASGPVGSLVGQLARLAGVRAVGIAGGPDKCRYVIEELGFDAAVDHRDPDMRTRLAEACPDGIDIYFENVGGAVWQTVLPLFNRFARVPVCGLIAQYDGAWHGTPDDLQATMRAVLTRSLTLRGFINYEFDAEHFPSFLDTVAPGVADGSIRYREDVTEGLENAPSAFVGMLTGRNFGKVLVRVAPDAVGAAKS
ncbi:NADP-dependent oxidoreductase [Lichenifustis flavocetrariae]|uniref:NADP-dependent oxidoreductase n=1 Tax=Lichenifustis flavocetrariae TaxID=2949735 RepID=A0AA42CJ96_9HYPH|nr:NADP-dependent oxidoreductase [Lichenifustis flavocetrariae]MCW6509214.1 NADP-dependent oxidoreductase [Lichenifustis flavocetrariae]